MKRVVILGSTGSIGRSALSVIERFSKEFSVVALSAGSNIRLLEAQIKKFKPLIAACLDKNLCIELKKRVSSRTKIVYGEEGLELVAALKETDIVVVAISGFSALRALLASIRAGKQIALANKEALVSAGSLISQEAKRAQIDLIPIDSEQCAIFQCLNNDENKKALSRIFLTASGGPFYFKKSINFKKVSKKDVLSHPRWSMGEKITVDSATLMNKGLEVIEAKWLFGVDLEKIKVLIHPQSTIHSMVEFVDRSVLAQISVTDMRLPIQFALTYPRRLKSPFQSVDFVKLREFSFFEPDTKRFPCLSLAYEAARQKSSAATVLNAANEEAVGAFLKDNLNFSDIPKVVEHTLNNHNAFNCSRLEDILAADSWARVRAREFINKA